MKRSSGTVITVLIIQAVLQRRTMATTILCMYVQQFYCSVHFMSRSRSDKRRATQSLSLGGLLEQSPSIHNSHTSIACPVRPQLPSSPQTGADAAGSMDMPRMSIPGHTYRDLLTNHISSYYTSVECQIILTPGKQN